jgi:hypothetical protein
VKYAVRVTFLGLLAAATAAAGDSAGCSISRGLYDAWLALPRLSPAYSNAGGALAASAPSATQEPEKRQTITREYRSYIQCLSEAQDQEVGQDWCKPAAGDRLAYLVCRASLYLKSGRTSAREFIDAFPGGKKGAELIWDLGQIAGSDEVKSVTPSVFLPEGPVYKLIDELFLLVLDDRESAAAKYFNIAGSASGDGARHMDEQMKLLLRESPNVVVRRWPVLRQYQPKLKKLLNEMSASLPPADMQKMRLGLASFCSKDNPDCPEITKLFGRLE